MRRTFLHCVMALSLLAPAAGRASEQSERLYTRGLVEFHAQRFDKALDYFNQAVAADPKDVYALYYRGVTNSRMGKHAESVADLKAAMAQKPDLDQAAFDLGYGMVQTGDHAGAVKWLTQAQRTPTLDGEASLYLGIAQLNLGDLNSARANLQRATQKNPALKTTARYYLGVTEFKARNLTQAEEHFAAVSAASPSSELGRQSTEFLTKMKGGAAVGTGRPYFLYGLLAFQYDSNVTIGPSDDDPINSSEADGRVALNVGGRYTPLARDDVQFSLGYEFFQSIHFSLDDFNTQDHRPYAVLTGNAGPVRLGLLGQYDYYFVKLDSFFQQWTALPWVTVPEGDFGHTELYYRMRSRDFYVREFRDAMMKDRNAFNHAVGARQFFYLGSPERYVALGYRFDHEDPFRDTDAAQAFSYNGHEVNPGFGWSLPWEIYTDLDYVYRFRDYASESDGREDNEHRIVFVTRKFLAENFAVTLGYFGIFNTSNKDFAEYDRHIVSAGVEARY